MRFWIRTKDSIEFQFADDEDKETCDLCLIEEISGRCKKGRYAARNSKGDVDFIYCHERSTVAKQAKHISKITTASFDTITRACQRRSDEVNELRTIAYHNAQKMNASIGQKLDKVIPDLSQPGDRISRIASEIEKNSIAAAKDILSVRKGVEQIEAEYNLVEVLDSREPFADNELMTVRAHKLLVSSFYLHADEFTAQKVYVDIQDTDISLRVDYGVAKSAISQIFSNAVKYCRPNSDIIVSLQVISEYVEISFTMESLKISNEDSTRIVELWGRGSQAPKKNGTGIGLYAVRRYMWMHKGYLAIDNGEKIHSTVNQREYTTNTFRLGFYRY